MAELFSGEGRQRSPQQKRPDKTRASQRAPEKARADTDQEALARYLKNRDEEQREITAAKSPKSPSYMPQLSPPEDPRPPASTRNS